MSDRRCVILFVKLPRKGTVKSRLARDMDEDFVLRLYESMVLDTIDTLRHASLPFRICFAPPDALAEARDWLGQEHAYMPQTGEDLGERMELAFARVFSEGMSEALLIGSDIPGLTAGMPGDAFHALATHDAVIGPANDGGYYLIGFKKSTFHPAVFRDMLWSTGSVFHETVERLQKASLTVSVMPECIDADTKADLIAFFDRNEGRDSSSRALALLRSHRESIGK